MGIQLNRMEDWFVGIVETSGSERINQTERRALVGTETNTNDDDENMTVLCLCRTATYNNCSNCYTHS